MIRAYRLFIVFAFAIFLSRAFFVMVPMHSYYVSQASDNRVRVEALAAPRGVMVDREGKLVATNIKVDDRVVRNYPDGEVVSGIVGYVSDGVGVTGLEKQYQQELVGQNGQRVIEETAGGKQVKEVSRTEPVSGDQLKLNLDLALQTTAYRALKNQLTSAGKAGAVVVTRINGEILALVSLPGFDPNLFMSGGRRGMEGGIYSDALAVVADEKRKPLFNRAVAGQFPPGSVYKIVTAFAGLTEKVIGENDLIEDSGEIIVGPYRFGNWYFDKYGGTEGKINVTKALARSNDIFFYRLGEKLGVDRLVAWSKKLGMGEKTGIDLPAEATGLLPTPLWSEKEKGDRWYLGDTYHLAIGQGDLLVTPLQINRMMASLVSGKKCPPRLYGQAECIDLKLDLQAQETVIEGMKMACASGGTGFPFFDLKGTVWCKTGTAQHGGEEAKPHAWIGVVIPGRTQELKNSRTQDDKIGDNSVVVTVMLDEAGEGSEQAGPVARRIVDYIMAGAL